MKSNGYYLILASVFTGIFISGCRKDRLTAPQEALALSPQFTVIEQRLLFTGGYADPSVIQMSNRAYLMYLNRFFAPDDIGTFILSSDDGINWTEETGVVFRGVATGRALLEPAGVRFYYPKPEYQARYAGEEPPRNIVSSFSPDGITAWREEGVLVRPAQGFSLGGPTVTRLKDGTYRMFFDEHVLIPDNRVVEGIIYGASSNNGLSWQRDKEPTILYDDQIEGALHSHPQPPQVVHPFVIAWPEENGYLMLYNAHTRIFAAYSRHGFNWEKLGYTGIVGADADAIHLSDGSFRIYFGGFSRETLGVVYTAILKVEN